MEQAAGHWRDGKSSYRLQILFKVKSPGMVQLDGGRQLPESQSAETAWPEQLQRSRAITYDNTNYYVGDGDVWSAFWNARQVINGPF